MGLQIASLNSGSNGNAYYIGNHTEAILVDAGLSCRETEKRMLGLGLNIQKLKAIFISHEHTDHIKGLDVLARKYSLPVYISQATYQNSRLNIPAAQQQWLTAGLPVNIAGLSIQAFGKKHDAADPYSFTIKHSNTTVGVFTDIGICCDNLISHFQKCHAAFLESNYDEEMLENGRYPYLLKQRIRGGQGHLSNKQALDIFINHRPEFMTHLLLSHLSRDNNDPQLALNMFKPHAQQTKVVVASRYEASEVFYISNPDTEKKLRGRPMQMDLFA
jgi:phosphoribosyl 1,2-cyclic phosphodiesterase